jgi:hypothetical protein
MPRWQCRYCEEEIESLNYSIRLTEYGTAYLDEDGDTCDHDMSDSDNMSDYAYTCPECGDELCLPEDLGIVDEDEDEEERKPEPVPITTGSIFIHDERRHSDIIRCEQCQHITSLEPGDDLEEECVCGGTYARIRLTNQYTVNTQ